MKTSIPNSLVILLLLSVRPIQGTKVWLPRVDFMDISNWEPPELPSAGQRIVFSSKLNALVGLPAGILTISSLFLPQQGALLLPEHSFSLNMVSREGPGISVATFKAPGRTPYYSGNNWASYDDQESARHSPNAAKPHAERVPCQYETAVFEVDMRIPKPVDLQYHESIEVGNVRFGSGIEGLENFHNFISSEMGQFLFYNAEDTLVLQGKCANAEKCPCQEPRQMDAICSNERCPLPHCLSPIQPAGHCCPLCGSVFRMNMASFQGTFNLQSFADKLRRKVASAEVDDADVEYHVGIDRTDGANVVQLIVVDKGEYGEKSVRLMNSLRPFFEKQFSSGFHISHAGQPHTPLEGGQVLAFVLFTLIAIAAFFSVTFAYHYDERLLPRLRAAVLNRPFFTTPFVFARFDPSSETDGLSVDVNFASAVQTVVESTEEAAAHVRDVEEGHASSFDNPMFARPNAKKEMASEEFDDVELKVK